jgi:hypothetical protein
MAKCRENADVLETKKKGTNKNNNIVLAHGVANTRRFAGGGGSRTHKKQHKQKKKHTVFPRTYFEKDTQKMREKTCFPDCEDRLLETGYFERPNRRIPCNCPFFIFFLSRYFSFSR